MARFQTRGRGGRYSSVVVTVVDNSAAVSAIVHADSKERTKSAAEAAARHMRDTVAVDTGATRDSIMAEDGEVSAGEAAVFLEYGTRNMPAQPFFAQGVEEGKHEMERLPGF